jgi:hypothetical protein
VVPGLVPGWSGCRSSLACGCVCRFQSGHREVSPISGSAVSAGSLWQRDMCSSFVVVLGFMPGRLVVSVSFAGARQGPEPCSRQVHHCVPPVPSVWWR